MPIETKEWGQKDQDDLFSPNQHPHESWEKFIVLARIIMMISIALHSERREMLIMVSLGKEVKIKN